MKLVSILGFVAAFLTSFALVPQVVRTFKTRDTRGISLWMFAMSSSGTLLWVIYGILLDEWPIIVSNIFSFVLLLMILIMKIRLG